MSDVRMGISSCSMEAPSMAKLSVLHDTLQIHTRALKSGYLIIIRRKKKIKKWTIFLSHHCQSGWCWYFCTWHHRCWVDAAVSTLVHQLTSPTPDTRLPFPAMCWGSLLVECQTRDRKVASLNPSRRSGIIIFSKVNFVCWVLFWCLFHPCVTAMARKKPRHSAKSAGDRLHLNTHTLLTQ